LAGRERGEWEKVMFAAPKTGMLDHSSGVVIIYKVRRVSREKSQIAGQGYIDADSTFSG